MSMASIFKFFEERFKEVLDPSRKKYIVGEHLRGPVPDSQESQSSAARGSINHDADDIEVKVENVDSTNTQTPTDEATNIDSNTDAQTPKAEL